MGQDVRWVQRFSNYNRVLDQLQDAVNLSKTRALSQLEKLGLIQYFKYTHELAWKTLQDFLESQETYTLFGSKDVVRQSFQLGLIAQGETWMNMIKSRNKTSHVYDEKTAEEIAFLITKEYFSEFVVLKNTLNILKAKT